MARLAKIVASKRKPKFEVRRKNRCELCGRARGYIGKFKLCRICFRTNALKGFIPGVLKASW
ncbi:MAG: type Z 30S ribosomal protein S14 [Oligoflexia bacterium]|nr:type Z 30S ribosomal protein S14 [Oligoflexia bacterium]